MPFDLSGRPHLSLRVSEGFKLLPERFGGRPGRLGSTVRALPQDPPADPGARAARPSGDCRSSGQPSRARRCGSRTRTAGIGPRGPGLGGFGRPSRGLLCCVRLYGRRTGHRTPPYWQVPLLPSCRAGRAVYCAASGTVHGPCVSPCMCVSVCVRAHARDDALASSLARDQSRLQR